MNSFLDIIRNFVKFFTRKIAYGLNKVFGRLISPNFITIIAVIAHLPITYFIAKGQFVLAGVLLIIFGLFDSLDGELARIQKRASAGGMLLDASTDRMKEAMIYFGISYYFINTNHAYFALWALGALAGSMLVSYVKAKGETAVASTKLPHTTTNRMFQDGLMRLEIRMALIVIALFTNKLEIAVIVIAILAWLTAFQRLIVIMKKLSDV